MADLSPLMRPPIAHVERDAAHVHIPSGLWRLALGALLANAFALPIVSYMGWFLASLVHETSHAAAGWLTGMPSFPGIRLDGHAAAVHGEQVAWLVAIVALGLGYGAWQAWQHGMRKLAVAAAAAALLQPLVALTGMRELLFLSAGHLGEIGFSALALHRSFDSEKSEAERVLYATVGAFLVARSATLFFGLMTSTQAVIEYYGSGSFGLTNDLIRIAEDVVGCGLGTVAAGFLALALAAPLAAVAPKFFSR